MKKMFAQEALEYLEFPLTPADFVDLPTGVLKIASLPNFMVTPDLARKLLARTIKVGFTNRKISIPLVWKYVRAMKAGWPWNGENIIQAETGAVTEGQHRLIACIVSGMPFWTTYTTGTKESDFATQGQGGPRSAGQVIDMLGLKEAHRLASAVGRLAKYMHKIDAGIESSRKHAFPGGIENSQILELVHEHPGMEESMAVVGHPKLGISESDLAFAHYVFTSVNPSMTRLFFRQLIFGIDCTLGTPAHSLREKTIKANLSVTGKLTDTQRTFYLFRCFRAHLRGEELHKLQQGKGQMKYAQIGFNPVSVPVSVLDIKPLK